MSDTSALSGPRLAGIGHNQGPSMERGHRFRKYLWTKARRDLLPTLPIKVVRMRLRRARELGLDYKTYAGVRASTGRDVIGFLFSSNALRISRRQINLPADCAAKVEQITACGKLALVHAPLLPQDVARANAVLDVVATAPVFTDSWSASRARIAGLLAAEKLPADGIIIVGCTALEREWTAMARAGGYLPAQHYFPETSNEL